MENNMKNSNAVFSYAFIGSLLFVAAFAFSMAYFSNILMFELSYITIAIALTVSSISLLIKAMQADKNRLPQL